MLSKRDTTLLLQSLKAKWPPQIVPHAKNIKVCEIEKDDRLLLYDDDSVMAVRVDNIILPFLGNANVIGAFPSVSVDMGAVKFVCNGAKVMRPGIVNFDPFQKDDIVVVKDKDHLKALAVGLSLEDSENAISMSKGSVVDNLHFVGDKFWNLSKTINFK